VLYVGAWQRTHRAAAAAASLARALRQRYIAADRSTCGAIIASVRFSKRAAIILRAKLIKEEAASGAASPICGARLPASERGHAHQVLPLR
jgi:hypothetical protein